VEVAGALNRRQALGRSCQSDDLRLKKPLLYRPRYGPTISGRQSLMDAKFCELCDLRRGALEDGAETDEERKLILEKHPRRAATKTDIDGTPLCIGCLDWELQERKTKFLLRDR
jgi:hypothetical protein